ncbi:EI24 domain-containing protein [Marinigracilibium pacificum]|uniref:EI24 domain-containing protein n=1 Tax=Marinigracilibium pacificum TaxID=2729599 RepID=A0A848J4J3_9BACT|nr:EI24 domain-containing protein [Marinigracilibium pacificum]NMM49269.1 EI24 domain-containing protein [Marinigracilibium pacificum]
MIDKIFNQLGIAMKSYSYSLNFVFTRKPKWLILPALANFILLMVVVSLAILYTDELITWVFGMFSLTPDDSWWGRIVYWVSIISIRIFVIFFFIKFYKYLMLILYAPILVWLSDSFQEYMTGYKKPFSWNVFFSDVWRGISIAFVNLLIEFGLYFILFFITILFPILSVITPVLSFLISSYFLAFAFIDYRNEYFDVSAKQSRRFVWTNNIFALGIGLVFNLMLFVPVIGIMTAPSVSLVASGYGANLIDRRTRYIQLKNMRGSQPIL